MKSAWCMAATAAALLFSTPLASYGQDPPTPAEPLDTPILLRLAPPEGRVSRYAHSTQTEVENPMMPSNTVMTMRTYQTQTVVRVADGVIRLRTTIDSTSTANADARARDGTAGLFRKCHHDGDGHTGPRADSGASRPAPAST